VRTQPSNARAYSNRGLTKFEKGDFDGALADYNRSVELSPASFQPYINRGIVKNKVGDENGSNSDFSKAIELNPNARAIIESKGYPIAK
jgi:Tfp pilus assembly protein PilF